MEIMKSGWITKYWVVQKCKIGHNLKCNLEGINFYDNNVYSGTKMGSNY
jgi:hypothetical protein